VYSEAGLEDFSPALDVVSCVDSFNRYCKKIRHPRQSYDLYWDTRKIATVSHRNHEIDEPEYLKALDEIATMPDADQKIVRRSMIKVIASCQA
jgi:hypothetical protein